MAGPAAAWGSVARGTDAYFKMINERGGIHGRKLIHHMFDDAYNPAKTKAGVKELQEGVGIFAWVYLAWWIGLLIIGLGPIIARGLAVAVSSGSGMNIGVSGALNGRDQTGGGEGYAIRSGRTDGAGGWVDTEAVDIVTLFNGANLGGKIDLSGGNDTLTFEGEAGTDSLISGGSGTDTLGLSGTGTAIFDADITDFERLVKSGSGRWILPGNLDMAGTIVNGGTLEVQELAPGESSLGIRHVLLHLLRLLHHLGNIHKIGSPLLAMFWVT